MKPNIHPTYFSDTQVVCACGNVFTTGSTKQQIRVEICAKCHPFYTGVQKFVDTVGNIEKFQARQKTAVARQATVKAKVAKKQEEAHAPKTLREMLQATKE